MIITDIDAWGYAYRINNLLIQKWLDYNFDRVHAAELQRVITENGDRFVQFG